MCLTVANRWNRTDNGEEIESRLYKNRSKKKQETTNATFFLGRRVTSCGRGCQMVNVSDNGWRAMSSSPVPLKTRRVGKRCTLHLSRLKHPPVGEVWKLGKRGVSSDVFFVI
ncbi:hypothetical protein TNCV_356561 [Trichonephila clavipes]|nr:hypothetical protein TNCV_356561 [Trichonephila clavipes]